MTLKIKSRHRIKLLLIWQLICIAAIFTFSRSPLLYIIIVLCFVPPIIISFSEKKAIICLSLVLLAFSQYSFILSAEPSYGEGWFSDAYVDYKVTNLISQLPHFTIGTVGSTDRMFQYSAFPGLQLFYSVLSKATTLSPDTLWLLSLPSLCLILVFSLLTIFEKLGFDLKMAAIAAILFLTCYSNMYFHSMYVRESFVFPLFFLLLALVLRKISPNQPNVKGHLKEKGSFIIIVTLLLIAITIGHHFTSYLLIAFLALFAAFGQFRSRYLKILLTAFGVVVIWGLYVTPWISQGVVSDGFNSAYEAFNRAFSMTSQTSAIMPNRSLFEQILTFAGYFSLAILLLFGLRSFFKSKLRLAKALGFFCIFMFVCAFIIRLYNISFIGGLGQRVLNFSYMGIAMIASLGIFKILGVTRLKRSIVMVIVCSLIFLMALGSLAQQLTIYTATPQGVREYPITNSALYVGASFINSYGKQNSLIGYNVNNTYLPNDEFDLAVFLATYSGLNSVNWCSFSQQNRTALSNMIYFVEVNPAFYYPTKGTAPIINADTNVVLSNNFFSIKVLPQF
jgi:hypothetical protein